MINSSTDSHPENLVNTGDDHVIVSCVPVCSLPTGAELSLFPLDRTILPRTSTPSVLMFPAALMLFSATILQSISTLALVLLIAMWS